MDNSEASVLFPTAISEIQIASNSTTPPDGFFQTSSNWSVGLISYLKNCLFGCGNSTEILSDLHRPSVLQNISTLLPYSKTALYAVSVGNEIIPFLDM